MLIDDRRGPIDPSNRVSLEVGGLQYGGWKSVRVRHSIEQLAGVYSLELHDRWPGQTTAWTIEPGQSCVLRIGDDTMITGYVDVNNVRVSPTEHSISIEGRDRTGDLVDCSAPPREWVGMSFEHVATELCRPFGVQLYRQLGEGQGGYTNPARTGQPAPLQPCSNGGDRLPRKAINSGDTVHKALEKLAKMQGVLLVSDRRGGLIVTRAGLGGRCRDVLATGQNILSQEYERSFANLYSEITVKGQANGATSTAAGSQTLSGAQTVRPSATVKRAAQAPQGGSVLAQAQSPSQRAAASTVGRYRPLIITADSQADARRCAERAAWEAGTRESRSRRLTITVQGWRQEDGTLWSINTLVRVVSPLVRADEDMLITSCEYKLDSSGTTTVLQLSSPKAFDVLREIPDPPAGGTKSPGKAAGKGTGKGGNQLFSAVRPRGGQER